VTKHKLRRCLTTGDLGRFPRCFNFPERPERANGIAQCANHAQLDGERWEMLPGFAGAMHWTVESPNMHFKLTIRHSRIEYINDSEVFGHRSLAEALVAQ